MGLCKTCGQDVYLKDGEVHCDNCGNSIVYICWNCKKEINVEEITPIYRQEKECSFCKFYICPTCNYCGKIKKKKKTNEFDECTRIRIRNQLIEDKRNGMNINNANIIIQVCGTVITGKNKRYCPRMVPFTHAKTTIKEYFLLMKGWKKKNEKDKELFNTRFKKITDMEIGTEFYLKDRREEGTKGIEVREAVNLAICGGYIELFKNENDFKQYKRVNKNKCEYWNIKNISKKICKKCNTIFDIENENEFCMVCPPNKHGEKLKLVIKPTNVSTCNCPASIFTNEVLKDG